MLPRDFLNRYGRPVVSVLPVPVGDFVRILPDRDRYFIGFYSIEGPNETFVFPDSEHNDADHGFELVRNNGVKEFTHQTHGAVVNLGWSIYTFVAGTHVTVVEAFMRPDKGG